MRFYGSLTNLACVLVLSVLSLVTLSSGARSAESAELPQSFDVGDFKLRGDQSEIVRGHLRQEALNRGQTFDESQDVGVALREACKRGPRILISMLAAPDDYVVELALEGLALKFGAGATAAAPKVLRLIEDSRQQERIAQLAVYTLKRISRPDDPSVVAALVAQLQRTAPEKFQLKATLTEVIGSSGASGQSALPLLKEQLQSENTPLQYRSFLAIAAIERASIPRGNRVSELRSLENLSPGSLLALFEEITNSPATQAKALSLLMRSSGDESPKYMRCLALEALRRTEVRAPEGVQMILSNLASDDAYLRASAALALASLDTNAVIAVPALVRALSQAHEEVRLQSAITLKRFGPKAAPAAEALAQALKKSTEYTPEVELAAYLEALKAIGPGARSASETLVALLPESSPLLRNRNKVVVHHLRGFILATLAEIGIPKQTLPFVLDGLANADATLAYAYMFASASRAAGALGPEARVVVPFLLRILKGEVRDDYITFETFNSHRSSNGEYTNCMTEALRALSRIGPDASEAVPYLEALLKKPGISLDGAGRLYRLPNVQEEARRALAAIQR